MVRFQVLCIFLCTGLQYAASAPNSGYVYSREVDAWLRLHLVPATWGDAGMRCYLEGGILASPTTSDMARVMAAMMTEHEQMFRVFTGINSILATENFTSLEGVQLSSIPVGWDAGEPNNANSDENCVALTSAGNLADTSCVDMLPYFCRKEITHMCGSKDNGYEWEARTGSCYKFHRFSKSWVQALATCYAEGGHLAIINSYTESTVLKELFAKNPISKIYHAHDADYAFIGFRQWDDVNWTTVHGTSLCKAGFEQWETKEPNNEVVQGKTEDCGSIYRNGLLNDAQCTLPYPYICEITP